MAEGKINLRNILLYGALAFVGFYVITHLLFNVFFIIEFTSEKAGNAYSLFAFLGMPVALSIIVICGLNITSFIAQCFLSLIIACITVFVSVIVMFGSMCLWLTTDTLYYNKENSSTIMLRDYGCGATDSTSPTTKAFKHSRILGLLDVYTEVDTNKLDKQQWLRAETK